MSRFSHQMWGTLALAAAFSAPLSACQKRKFNAGAEVRSDRPSAPDKCGEPLDPKRPNPAHCDGPFFVDGPFTIDEAKFAQDGWAGGYDSRRMGPYVAGLFGTTTLYDPAGKAILNPRTGKPKVIRDLHYHLGGGRVGMRPIPVAPASAFTRLEQMNEYDRRAAGPARDAYIALMRTLPMRFPEPYNGSEFLDLKLREFYGYPQDANGEVFSLAAYLYPGTQKVYVQDLAESKSQGSIGHMAAYMGKGIHRASPKGLHNDEWTVQGHEPSTLIGVKFKGTSPQDVQRNRLVNRNLAIMTRIMNDLNGGPQFPGDYTFDPVRVYNLQAMFEFFRKWIVGGAEAELLKSDPTWGIYCAEYVTLVTNLGLNLPLNKAYFERIWPNGVGTRLWERFKERYQEAFGSPLVEDTIPANAFQPLWELDGLPSPLRETRPSQSLAWPLDTTADLVGALIENFGSWPDVTPILSTAIMLNFANTASERVGVSPDQFVSLVMPLAIPSFKHHISTLAEVNSPQAYEAYVATAERSLGAAGAPPQLVGVVVESLKNPGYMQAALGLPKVPVAQAWRAYTDEIQPALANARKFAPPFSIGQQRAYRAQQMVQVQRLQAEALARGDRQLAEQYQYLIDSAKNLKTFVRFNSPPSLGFRVANGLRPSHPALDVQVIGSIFYADLLKPEDPAKKFFLPEDLALPQLPPPEPDNPRKDWDPEVFRGENGPVG